ncbi:hypothetical protein HPT27_02935 [Permianibacter sp. IMCC34836]|uniref:hypothetical protein n=1 Tax=Permianibacter fluminis TaxID=2738515 RepID=UPI0015517A1C|nr:hypothetical protein [Permianibacter fluminis]NQD35962.1 hypothetical protein [Permianibacter fluminis]
MALKAKTRSTKLRPGKLLKAKRKGPKLTAEQRAEKARAKRVAAAKKKITAMKAKQAKQLAAFKAKLAKALEKFEAKAMKEVDKPKRRKKARRKAGMNKTDLIEVTGKTSH